VLGRDKHADRYRALAHRFGLQDRVHFKGEVEDPLPYLGAADAMVLPTLYDPFPNAVLEGLACGLPVVTSDGCGAVDVIRAGQNGWIHRASDVVDLRSKLVSWLDRRADPGGPALLAQAARASVLGYGTDILARELIRLYEELLARPA
jgi:UDP-glucose:(heptosyl)LPS alpha-1,3-glucosyltransferase